VFLTIAKAAALEAAQTGTAVRKAPSVPFCSACVKVMLIGLTLPVSVFFHRKWGSFIMGKRKEDEGHIATLPDGASVQVCG
jgi:hypothetical protein